MGSFQGCHGKVYSLYAITPIITCREVCGVLKYQIYIVAINVPFPLVKHFQTCMDVIPILHNLTVIFLVRHIHVLLICTLQLSIVSHHFSRKTRYQCSSTRGQSTSSHTFLVYSIVSWGKNLVVDLNIHDYTAFYYEK